MNKNRIIAILALAAFLVIALTGCGESIEDNESSDDQQLLSKESAGPMNCVVIYSQHANSQASASGLEKFIRGAKESEGCLAFVRLDGAPSLTSEGVIDTTIEHNNETRIKREVDKFVNSQMDVLENVRAETEEVDVLDAIKTANDILKEEGNSSLANYVVISGTGLSTSGVIDFKSVDLASLDFDDYATWIQESGQLPKLDNIDTVIWYGFDKVASPQEKFPTETLRESLEQFYVKLLTEAGVGSVEIKSAMTTAEPASDLPNVTTVSMPPKPKYGAGDSVDVPTDILFNPDQATFLDGADPKENEVIKEAAYSIKAGELTVIITGYTAHYDTESGCEALSLARAEAVKNVLIELGCPADSITTVGGGWGPYGEGTEEVDQKNRCVQFEFE